MAAPPAVEGQLAARANLHFRLVEVVMMLMLPLLAIALAVPPKRSTSSLGIFVVDRDGRDLSQGQPICRAGGRAGPARPDPGVVGAVPASSSRLIFWMYHVLAHRPGGQPIGALERGFARLGEGAARSAAERRRCAGMINLDFMPSKPWRSTSSDCS